MGEASASSASSSPIQTTSNIYDNQPNYVMWIVIGVAALLAALVFLKVRKK